VRWFIDFFGWVNSWDWRLYFEVGWVEIGVSCHDRNRVEGLLGCSYLWLVGADIVILEWWIVMMRVVRFWIWVRKFILILWGVNQRSCCWEITLIWIFLACWHWLYWFSRRFHHLINWSVM
jgi:hypothetical protein